MPKLLRHLGHEVVPAGVAPALRFPPPLGLESWNIGNVQTMPNNNRGNGGCRKCFLAGKQLQGLLGLVHIMFGECGEIRFARYLLLIGCQNPIMRIGEASRRQHHGRVARAARTAFRIPAMARSRSAAISSK